MELATAAKGSRSNLSSTITPCSHDDNNNTIIITNSKPSFNRRQSTSSSSSFRLRCKSLNTVRLRRIFDLFDKNSDNIITAHELSQALHLLGLDADLSDLQSTVNSYIRPGNTGLLFDDFLALHKSLDESLFCTDSTNTTTDLDDTSTAAHEESDLAEAFKVFDEDGDGFICAKELQAVLRKLGFHEGSHIDTVQQMIVSVDNNHDGVIDFFEFKHMMRSTVMVPSS